MPDLESRVDLLERAQLLHDATLRRHGELLDAHATAMTEMRQIQERQYDMLALLQGIQLGQAERLILLEQQTNDLRQLVHAIKDLLDRPNGH